MSQEEFNAKVIAQSTPEQLAELFDEACQLVYNLGDDVKYLDNLHRIVRKLEIKVEQDCDCPSCQKQCKLSNQDWLKMASVYRIDDGIKLIKCDNDKYIVSNTKERTVIMHQSGWSNLVNEGAYFDTKEAAFVAYQEWKKAQAKESE